MCDSSYGFGRKLTIFRYFYTGNWYHHSKNRKNARAIEEPHIDIVWSPRIGDVNPCYAQSWDHKSSCGELPGSYFTYA